MESYIFTVMQLMSHFHVDMSSEFCHTLWTRIIFPHLTNEKSEVQKSSVIFLNNMDQIWRL